jgi:hypothetical protein
MTSGYGTCTVTFSQAGNSNYDAAPAVELKVSATPWKVNGFYQPVTPTVAGAPIWNVVKGGSTVPLKFEIFAGVNGPEQTALTAVQSMSAQLVNCTPGPANAVSIEMDSSGGTLLRYEDGQFIQNWKTPKAPGSCLRVTMEAADSSKITAFFQLK